LINYLLNPLCYAKLWFHMVLLALTAVLDGLIWC